MPAIGWVPAQVRNGSGIHILRSLLSLIRSGHGTGSGSLSCQFQVEAEEVGHSICVMQWQGTRYIWLEWRYRLPNPLSRSARQGSSARGGALGKYKLLIAKCSQPQEKEVVDQN